MNTDDLPDLADSDYRTFHRLTWNLPKEDVAAIVRVVERRLVMDQARTIAGTLAERQRAQRERHESREAKREARRLRQLRRAILGRWYSGKGFAYLGWVQARCREWGFSAEEIESGIAGLIADGTLVQTMRGVPALERAPEKEPVIE
jgi:hypothetical protein